MPGKPHGQRSLAGYSPWGGKESDMTELLTHTLQFVACLFILLLLLLLFSSSVVSYSLQPHVLQHARLLCCSPSPRVSSNSCPLSRSCHPVILSSLIPFSSCLQSFPPSGCFPKSGLFASSGQSFGASASTSVLPMNIQG